MHWTVFKLLGMGTHMHFWRFSAADKCCRKRLILESSTKALIVILLGAYGRYVAATGVRLRLELRLGLRLSR